VLAFLVAVQSEKEPDSNATRNITSATGLSRQRLNQLARRLLYPPAETLQLRVDGIVARHPEQRAEVARALAADIRAVQAEDQQLLHANQQFARALVEAVKKMEIKGDERDRIYATVKQLDATRSLAVREINAALHAANSVLTESGAAEPSTIAKVLVGK
jgi:cytochrome c-type biogenesis protein CcmH/NrfF